MDGLPLAIELAAAQLRHLTLADLTNRFDDSLRILVGGRPRAGARHATLASTIGWSHDLLAGSSRDTFARLGVFRATFDLAAVRAVAGLDEVAAANVMGDLVAKSLVVHHHDSGRYRLLETIRLFAADRLEATGQRTEVTELLRRHVLDRNTAARRPRAWLSASLAAANRDDIENVRVAFDASIAAGRYDDAVDLVIGLSSLWRNAASYAEGLRWAAALMRHDLAPRDRMWLHIVEADLGLGSGDPRLMADGASAALALASTVDDRTGGGHRVDLPFAVGGQPRTRARRGGVVDGRRPGPRGRRARAGTAGPGVPGGGAAGRGPAGRPGRRDRRAGRAARRRVRPVHLRVGGLGGRAGRPGRHCGCAGGWTRSWRTCATADCRRTGS